MEYLIQYIFAVSVFLLACIVVCVVLYYIIEIIFEAKYRQNLFSERRNKDMDDDEDEPGGGGTPPKNPTPPLPVGGISPYLLYRGNDYEFKDFSRITSPPTISLVPEEAYI